MLLAELGLLGEGRRPQAVAQETGVSPPAPPARGGQVAVAAGGEIGEHVAVLVAHDRADRDGHDEVVAVAAVAFLAASVAAVAGAPVGMVDEGEQRGEVRRGLEVDAAAAAAVAAVGAALGDVRLPAERDRAGAAVAAFYVDLRLVDESRCHSDLTAVSSTTGRTGRARATASHPPWRRSTRGHSPPGSPERTSWWSALEHVPGARLDLVGELAGPPAGVAGEDADLGERHRDVDRVLVQVDRAESADEGCEAGRLGRLGELGPPDADGGVRLHRAPDEQAPGAMAARPPQPGTISSTGDRARPVEHDAERPVVSSWASRNTTLRKKLGSARVGEATSSEPLPGTPAIWPSGRQSSTGRTSTRRRP